MPNFRLLNDIVGYRNVLNSHILHKQNLKKIKCKTKATALWGIYYIYLSVTFSIMNYKAPVM